MTNELEDRLRSTLAEKRAEVATSPLAPERVVRRARRRRIATSVVATTTVVAVTVLVVLGAQSLFDRAPASRPGGDEVTPAPEANVGTLPATGVVDGVRWTLDVSDESSGGSGGSPPTLSFDWENLSGGGSGIAPVQGDRVFGSYGGSSTPEFPDHDPTRTPLPWDLSGMVRGDVARVELQLEQGGVVEGSVYDVPDDVASGSRAFLVLVPGDTLLVAGDLVAYDADGNELGREYADQSLVPLFPKVVEESAPDAVAVMHQLQLAGAIVGRYYDVHGSFSGLDQASASAISDGVTFNESDVAIPGEVSLRIAGPSSLVLASATPDGAVYSACVDGGMGSMYGRNDTSDPDACSNGWLDTSSPPPPSPNDDLAIAHGDDGADHLWSLALIHTDVDEELELELGPIVVDRPLEPLAGANLGSIAAVAPTDTPVDAQADPTMPGAFYGLASSDVDRVELRTDDGRTIAGTLYPVDTPRTDATQIFLILVPDGANVSGTVVATDATGAEIASEQVTNAR